MAKNTVRLPNPVSIFENVQLFFRDREKEIIAISLKFDQTFESGPKYKTSHFWLFLEKKKESEKKTF